MKEEKQLTLREKVSQMRADYTKQLAEVHGQIRSLTDKVEQLKGAVYAVDQVLLVLPEEKDKE